MNIQFYLESSKYVGYNVYAGYVHLPKPGKWTIQVQAKHWVQFPPYESTVEVVPKSTALPDPKPFTPVKPAEGNHGHGTPAANLPTSAPTASQTTTGAETTAPAPANSADRLPLIGVAGAASVVAAIGGFMLGRWLHLRAA